jgi:hypothetical protein
MVHAKEEAPICLSVEEVAVRSGQEVLLEVDDNFFLIVVDPRRTSDHHLKPHHIHSLNIIILNLLVNHILVNN